MFDPCIFHGSHMIFIGSLIFLASFGSLLNCHYMDDFSFIQIVHHSSVFRILG